MQDHSKNKASIPNPALAAFSALAGTWETTGSHPLVPGIVLKGRCSFRWLEGGAFLLWQSAVDYEGFPEGVSIFGSDNETGDYFMLYFDERKVSRKYDVAIEGNVIKWWRNAPALSQRYNWTISEDGNSIVSKGEMSKNGTDWEKDLEQTFIRIG